MLVADPALSRQSVEQCLRRVYVAYADYGLKNPFYDIDMPLRCPLFEQEINKIFAEHIRS